MELFGLPAAVFLQGGSFALLLATIWLVVTGRLVPRSTHEDVRSDRDHWRSAYLAEQEINRVQAQQLGELLELARTTSDVVKALPPPGRQQPRGGR